MACPLYREAHGRVASLGTDGNTGLWFDKFCDRWRDGWTLVAEKEISPKLAWIGTVTSRSIGHPAAIRELNSRTVSVVVARGGIWQVLRTESRFVTGLGRSHPVENGFAWHSALGTPYLPGSSVKGMVRSWAEQEGCRKDDLERLFGAPGRRGGICFLDALPTEPVTLDADVMTPHYAGWTPDDPPGDWRSPVPVAFLVAAAGSPFLFGLVSGAAAAEDDLGIVWKWLTDALAWAGAGAKTAVGYGRFAVDGGETDRVAASWEATRQRRETARAREEALATPEGRWRWEFRSASEERMLDLIRVHLEKEPLPDIRERAAFAAAVPEEMMAQWRRGESVDKATKLNKQRIMGRARLVDESRLSG
jgi:CRISPR-associated protein Cmr6